MKLFILPNLTVAIAISLLVPPLSVRADQHREGKAAGALGKALAELNQNAESVAEQADKARQMIASELTSSRQVLAEARKVLASAEKAEADAVARLEIADANVREVEAVRNAIRQANETAKKHLAPKSPAKAAEVRPQPQKPKKAESAPAPAKPQ